MDDNRRTGRAHLARTLLGTTFALVGMVAIASCGGGGDDDDSAPQDERIPAGAPTIDQDNLKFEPTELTVSPGTDVFFRNSESALHTVTINDENESGSMEGNDLFVWVAGEPGEYAVTCDFHPQMKATITVE